MVSETDSRLAALMAAAGDQVQAALLTWLFEGFARLEETDFAELEPVGVAAPVPP